MNIFKLPNALRVAASISAIGAFASLANPAAAQVVDAGNAGVIFATPSLPVNMLGLTPFKNTAPVQAITALPQTTSLPSVTPIVITQLPEASNANQPNIFTAAIERDILPFIPVNQQLIATDALAAFNIITGKTPHKLDPYHPVLAGQNFDTYFDQATNTYKLISSSKDEVQSSANATISEVDYRPDGSMEVVANLGDNHYQLNLRNGYSFTPSLIYSGVVLSDEGSAEIENIISQSRPVLEAAVKTSETFSRGRKGPFFFPRVATGIILHVDAGHMAQAQQILSEVFLASYTPSVALENQRPAKKSNKYTRAVMTPAFKPPADVVARAELPSIGVDPNKLSMESRIALGLFVSNDATGTAPQETIGADNAQAIGLELPFNKFELKSDQLPSAQIKAKKVKVRRFISKYQHTDFAENKSIQHNDFTNDRKLNPIQWLFSEAKETFKRTFGIHSQTARTVVPTKQSPTQSHSLHDWGVDSGDTLQTTGLTPPDYCMWVSKHLQRLTDGVNAGCPQEKLAVDGHNLHLLAQANPNKRFRARRPSDAPEPNLSSADIG